MDIRNELRTVKLTHHYSHLTHRFYGIRTSLIPDDLAMACAYIQLLRDELPTSLAAVDDVIGESDGMTILAKLYGAEELREEPPEGVAETLDFHDNWESVASRLDKHRYHNGFSRVARPGARLAIIEAMLREARDNSDQASTEILEHIYNGGMVTADQNLMTIEGIPYTGKLSVTDKPDYPRSGC